MLGIWERPWTSRPALVTDIESLARFLPSERMGEFRVRLAAPDPSGWRRASQGGESAARAKDTDRT